MSAPPPKPQRIRVTIEALNLSVSHRPGAVVVDFEVTDPGSLAALKAALLPGNEPWVPMKAAAAHRGISVRTLAKVIRRLPKEVFSPVGGRHFRLSKLDEWFQAHPDALRTRRRGKRQPSSPAPPGNGAGGSE